MTTRHLVPVALTVALGSLLLITVLPGNITSAGASPQPENPAPHWIWYGAVKGESTVYLRKSFSLNGPISSATLTGSGDNHLVVYLNGAGWSERIENARIAGDDAAASCLLAQAEGPGQEVRVIAPYLIDVALEGAVPRPVSTREAIRAQGPTVRLDLGKQAEVA